MPPVCTGPTGGLVSEASGVFRRVGWGVCFAFVPMHLRRCEWKHAEPNVTRTGLRSSRGSAAQGQRLPPRGRT